MALHIPGRRRPSGKGAPVADFRSGAGAHSSAVLADLLRGLRRSGIGAVGVPPAAGAPLGVEEAPADPGSVEPPATSDRRLVEAPERDERLGRLFGLLQGVGGLAQLAGGLTGSDMLAAAGQGVATGAGGVLAEERARFLERQQAFEEFLREQQRHHRQLELEALRGEERRARDLYQRNLEEYRHQRGLAVQGAERERRAEAARLESRIGDLEAAGEFGDAYRRALVEARGYTEEEARAVAEGKRGVWEVEQQWRRRRASGAGRTSSSRGRATPRASVPADGKADAKDEYALSDDAIVSGEALSARARVLLGRVNEGVASRNDRRELAAVEAEIRRREERASIRVDGMRARAAIYEHYLGNGTYEVDDVRRDLERRRDGGEISQAEHDFIVDILAGDA